MSFLVDTYLDLGLYNGTELNFGEKIFFSFYASTKINGKIKEIHLSLKEIKGFASLCKKKYNKNGYFIDFVKYGVIKTDKNNYFTDVKYIVDLRNNVFNKKHILVSKNQIIDKTINNTVKKNFDLEYVIV